MSRLPHLPNSAIDFDFGTITSVLGRESRARTAWIISPHLFYDIHNPTFRQVISVNKTRKVRYRYIVPDTVEIRSNLVAYQELYKDSAADMEESFLLLESSDFVNFLTEVAIYDPGEADMFGFAVPPSCKSVSEDVIVMNRDLSQQYAKRFSDIWLRKRHTLP